MKSIIFSVMPLAIVSANPLQPRQLKEPALSPTSTLTNALKEKGGPITADAIRSVLPAARLVKTEEQQPSIHKEAKRLVSTYGPYVLVGRNEPRPKSMTISLDPNGQGFMDVISDGLPSDVSILTGKVMIKFENGTDAGPASGIYIHHVVSTDLSKQQAAPVSRCSKGQKNGSALGIGSEFIAQGDDTLGGPGIKFASNDGSSKSGYWVAKGQLVMQQIDLVNYNEANQTLFATYDIEYVNGREGLRDASKTLLSVTGCPQERAALGEAGRLKLIPNGVAVTESPQFIFEKDSTLVSATGHLHDGGSSMHMFNNGKEVCESKAIYGKGGLNNDETIVEMTFCPPAIKFKKGDVLTMKAVYDLQTHPIRNGGHHSTMGGEDVMGMFSITFTNDS